MMGDASRPLPRRVLLVSLFIATFLGTCIFIRRHFAPRVPIVTAKLEQLTEERDEIDVVFLGSSLIYRHIVPAVFDDVTAESGHPLHSFNLGVPGMSRDEAEFLVDRVVRLPSARLRYIVLDVDTAIVADNPGTSRFLYWRSWAGLGTSLSRVEQASVSSGYPRLFGHFSLSSFGEDLRATFQNVTNAGSNLNPLHELWAYKPDDRRAEEIARSTRGYVPLRPNPEFDAGKAEAIRRQLRGPIEDADDIFRDPHLSRVSTRVRSSGKTPMFLRGPLELPRRVPRVDAAYVAFDDPERFPGLYDPAKRHDRTHLNDLGAREYTRLVALSFLDRIFVKDAPVAVH